MKRTLYILIFTVISFAGYAQQQITFTNFLLNDYYYNPAIAGSRKVHVANLSYRTQWTGFTGAPKTLMGSFYGSFRNNGINGYGAMITSDRTGLTQRTGLYLNYAQHFKLSEKTKLAFGVQPGYLQYRVALYDAQLADQGDDILTGNVLSANAVDINAGFHLYSDRFFVMGSVNQLLGDQIQFTTYNPGLAIHYTGIVGYTFGGPKNTAPAKDSMGRPVAQKKNKIEIMPAVMVKYSMPTPPQFDIMLKTIYDKKFWFGLTYRTNDAASISLGYNHKNRLNVGYAFDYSISGINQYQHGSHELVLSFTITRNKPSLDEKDEELNNSIMDQMKKNNK